KQASHFVHIPGLSYSGVKSPTECQQSLFESHFASRQSLSDCPVRSEERRVGKECSSSGEASTEQGADSRAMRISAHTSLSEPARPTGVCSRPRAVRYLFFFKQKTAYEIGLGIPAEPLFRSKQASHFVHIPGLSYSGVKSPTECQQSLFESHFASRQSLSDCPVAF